MSKDTEVKFTEPGECEGCGKPATTSDSEGVELCDDCAEICQEDEE